MCALLKESIEDLLKMPLEEFLEGILKEPLETHIPEDISGEIYDVTHWEFSRKQKSL